MKASISILRALTNVRDLYIADSELPTAVATEPYKREYLSSREKWQRVTSSGWFVAAICAVVSFGVLSGIIWAGQRDPGAPPIAPPSTETADSATETDEPENAIPFTEGLEFTPAEGEDGYCAVGGIGTATDRVLRIPATSPDGLIVKYIGAEAFLGNTRITEVILPDTVEVIQEFAFRECVKLKKVTVGASFTTVAAQAFYGCRSLSDINLNATHNIDTYAMFATPWLEKHTEEFVIYGGHLIDYNGRGGNVVIPQGVVHVEGGSFSPNSTITSVTFPDSCTTIREQAFSGCSALTRVVAPASVTYIGSGAFGWCPSLEYVEIPGVDIIAYRAFRECTSLKEIDLPNTRIIFQEAFAGCTALSSVTTGDTLISVLDNAFQKTGVTTCIFPENVKNLSVSALADCPNLTYVETYAQLVKDSCFANSPQLREIVLHDGVEVIGADIFKGCTSLERITVPATVTEIGHISGIPSESLVIEYAGTAEQWAAIRMDEQTATLLLAYVTFTK